MNTLELACMGVILLYVVPRAILEPRRGRLLLRLLLLSAAGCAGEISCVRLYGFYAYATDRWTVFLDVVPLAVVLTWPVVVHSAWDLGRLLRPGAGVVGVGLITGGMVMADAALIEPVAVHVGLWSWSEPGLLAVPPVGVLGWAAFAFLAACALEHWERRPDTPLPNAGLLLLAPVLLHPILLALWWAALRWVSVDLPIIPFLVLLGIASLALTCWFVIRPRPGVRAAVVSRCPGAVFFFVLLALHFEPLLCAWVSAFALPYLALGVSGKPDISVLDS